MSNVCLIWPKSTVNSFVIRDDHITLFIADAQGYNLPVSPLTPYSASCRPVLLKRILILNAQIENANFEN